jgi:hypothetical protein
MDARAASMFSTACTAFRYDFACTSISGNAGNDGFNGAK